MARDIYEGPAELYFNNSLLAEARSIRVAITGNNRKVYTMKKGLAGRSRGPVEVEVTVENAVPKGGLEADFNQLCVDNEDVDIVYVQAGKRITIEGWIESVDNNQGTDDAAAVSFTAMAGKPRITS